MPYRNYGLSAERLMPLSYSGSKQSLRVWMSGGSSIDVIHAFTLWSDSSSSGRRIELGQKILGKKKWVDHYSQTQFVPSEGIVNFFKAWDTLDPFTYKDQPENEFEIPYHHPLKLVIVEYFKESRTVTFQFQQGASRYKSIEEFLAARNIKEHL